MGCPGWWELRHLQAYCVVLGEPTLSFTTLTTFLFELGTELGNGFLVFLNISFQNLHISLGGNKAYSEKKMKSIPTEFCICKMKRPQEFTEHPYPAKSCSLLCAPGQGAACSDISRHRRSTNELWGESCFNY